MISEKNDDNNKKRNSKKKKNTVIDIFTLIEEKQIRGNIVKKIFHAIFCLIS